MSGPSTLRICLAAMAPALTEAASARLRLQDTSDSQINSNKKSQTPRRGTDSVEISRTLSVSNDDLKALGGRKRLKGEGRVTHLSLANSDRDTRELDSKVSSITCKTGNLQGFTTVSPQTANTSLSRSTITRLDISKINIVPRPTVESPFYVSEDFQESSSVPQTTLLGNLSIMNKPETGVKKGKESGNIAISGCTKSDDLSQILKSSHNHAPFNKNLEPSMVNGNDVDERSKGQQREEGSKDCDESGNSPRKKTPSVVNKRTVHFTEWDKPQALSRKVSEKMGVTFTGKDSMPSNSTQILSLGTHSAQFHAMETMDMKSRDEARKESARKQAYLERKVETLLRRLKRMRGKVVETHSREQLRQFVNYQHRSLQQVAKVMRSEAPGPAELKEHFLSNDEVKSMSTTELVKLVKTYQPLAAAHNSRPLAPHMSNHRGISSSLARLGGHSSSAGPVMVMEPGLRAQSAEVSERLGQRINTVSAELDSDATASSSGGESGDEEDLTPKTDHSAVPKPKFASDMPPLFKRAEWRWASDRAGIVSRWTWLQAQVSDLEYRIRQQSQVHRQLRASKGGVVLGDPPSTSDILRRIQGMAPHTAQAGLANSEGETGQEGDLAVPEESREGLEVSPCNIQAVMSNIDKQASRLTQSLGNCLSPASSSASAATSVVGSPRVASSTSSPGRSPAHASLRDSSPAGASNMENSGPSVPTELSLASRTSDLLHTPLQQRVPPTSLLVSSSSSLPSSAPSNLDATCQSARCRPLRSYRKRRILRTVGLHRHSHKAARLSDVKCRCSPPANPCPMCGGRQNNTLSVDTETMSFQERIALVDASFHSILSFPEDISLPIHCEGLLKSGQWQEKQVPKRSRGSHRNHHYRGSLLLAGEYNFHNNKRPQNNNNNNHHHQGKVLTLVSAEKGKRETKKKKARKNVVTGGTGQNNRTNAMVGPSTASVIKNFSEKIKNKYESKAKSKGATAKVKVLAPRTNKPKKKASKVAKDALKRKKEAETREEDEDLEALYLEQELGDIDGENGGGNLSASASQSSLRDMGHQHHRGNRRRLDNSYDINNIVIPLSMATSVPVEQPQYKEIVTPKWREVPVCNLSSTSVAAAARDSLASKLEKTNGVARPMEQLKSPELPDTVTENSQEKAEKEHEEEDEDLSDEKFAMRHLKFELEEKKRFRNFVQYPPLRRNRARSDVSLSAMEVLPSEENSMSSRPTTPILMKSLPSVGSGKVVGLEESLASLQHQVQGHRPRTVSLTVPSTRRDSHVTSQPGQDIVETLQRDLAVEPWPRRIFPLANEEYECMLEEAPADLRVITHQHETRYACSNVAKPAVRARESANQEITCDTETRHADTVLDGMAGVGDSVALSPQSVSASASASSTADDDQADPEWIGGADNSSNCKRGRSRRILDDPSDPEWLGSDMPRKNKIKR